MIFWVGADHTLLGPYRRSDEAGLAHAMRWLADSLRRSGQDVTIFCFPARTRWGASRKLRRMIRHELVAGMSR